MIKMIKEKLKHHFLVAMPRLKDPNFQKSVIYLHEHNKEGAMGLVINKPLQINLGNVLRHLNIKITDDSIELHSVMMGGPVRQEHGFVIYSTLSKEVSQEIDISSSKSMLQKIAQGQGPKEFLITLGYAGWGSGQLEYEINRNDWLIAPFNKKLLFSTPNDKRWQAAAALLGVDINQLSGQVGHA